jgi:hypothetical protein
MAEEGDIAFIIDPGLVREVELAASGCRVSGGNDGQTLPAYRADR